MSDELQGALAHSMPVDTAPVPGEPAIVRDTGDDKITQTMEAAYDRATHRAPNGQFSKLPPRLSTEADFPKNHEAPPADEAGEQREETPVDSDINPPASLDTKTREHWKSTPPDIQRFISERELQAQQKISELGRSAKQLGELSGVFEQFRETIPKLPNGQAMPPQSVIQHLLTANHILETNPKGAIEWLARSKGIDLSEFAGQQQHAPQQVDLEQVRNEAYQAALQHMHQQQTAVHEQQASNYIEKFAEGKPYWPQIENQVLYHILALKGTNPEMDYRELLQTAHDRALSEQRDLDPRAKAKAQEELSERKRKADEARRLASLNVRSNRTGATPMRRGTIEQTLEEVYDRIHAHG